MNSGPLKIPRPISTVTALNQGLFEIMWHFAIPILSQIFRERIENYEQQTTVHTFSKPYLMV